jgi:hypothetical protein
VRADLIGDDRPDAAGLVNAPRFDRSRGRRIRSDAVIGMTMVELPEGCDTGAQVYGQDGRVWPTAVCLSALVLSWLGYGIVGDDAIYVRSVWAPASAALFVGWLQWDASRSRVVLDSQAVWVRNRRGFKGPLAYADVAAVAVGHPRSGISFFLANRSGVGRPARRTPWRFRRWWGFSVADTRIGELADFSVLVVPRLARTATNRAVYAALGQRLIDAGAPFTPNSAAIVQDHIARTTAPAK